LEDEIKIKITGYIVANFLFGNAGGMPAEDASLIENGVFDSTGILELIEFLEGEFSIKIDDTETLPQNLDSVANLTAFVTRKKAAALAGVGDSAQ
jgi:acyl carrier protein